MRACPACGASNGSTDDFCGNCGGYLGWSDTTPAPSTAAPGPTPPDTAPGPASPPAHEPASTRPPRISSSPTRPTAGSRSEAQEQHAKNAKDAKDAKDAEDTANTAGSHPGDVEHPGLDAAHGEPISPPQAPLGSPPRPRSGAVRTPPPAHRPTAGDSAPPHAGEAPPARAPDPGHGAPTASGTEARPPHAPAPSPAPLQPPTTRNTPGPRPPGTPVPGAPTPNPAPVRPAKPVTPRPVVRAVEEPDPVAGTPCPVCGTPNLPGRRFCRRCAAELNPAAAPAPLPRWRTMWPFRRRVRAGSGRAVRLLVVLAVVVALCAVAFLLLPAGRALFEDTRDKLGKPKAITPVTIAASAEVPGHPASNTTDGQRNRYWGAPAPGDSVTYTFPRPFRLVDLIITNGASKDAEEYHRQARALQLDMEVTALDGVEHDKRLTLSDKPGAQTFATGISGVKTVRLTLRSPAGLAAGRHLALAEVEFFERS